MTDASNSAAIDFAQEIAELAAPAAGSQGPQTGFLDVVRKFVSGLEQAGIGAALRRAGDGVRHTLVLWPKYRPGWRTLMLTFRFEGGAAIVTSSSSRAFDTPDDLQAFLRQFAKSKEFQSTLSLLHEQATEPVEARLEIEGEEGLLVEVSPEFQQKLSEAGETPLELDVELEPGENVPEPNAIRRLRSAGIDVSVQQATVRGRRVHLAVGSDAS